MGEKRKRRTPLAVETPSQLRCRQHASPVQRDVSLNDSFASAQVLPHTKRLQKKTKRNVETTSSQVAEVDVGCTEEEDADARPNAAVDAEICGEVDTYQESALVEGQGTQKVRKKKKQLRDKWGQKVYPAVSARALEAEENDSIITADTESQEQYEPNKVCVGGMPYSTSEEDIHTFFAGCGTITELDCLTFRDSGKFKGLAFISFKSEAAANRALDLDGADMCGRFLKIDRCKVRSQQQKKKEAHFQDPPKKVEGCCSVYIGNLAWNVEEMDIRRFFSGCKIKAVRLALDKNSGEFRGFGHIDFADDSSLEMAVKMDQGELLGRPIKIAYAVPKGFVGKRRTCQTCAGVGHLSTHCPKLLFVEGRRGD